MGARWLALGWPAGMADCPLPQILAVFILLNQYHGPGFITSTLSTRVCARDVKVDIPRRRPPLVQGRQLGHARPSVDCCGLLGRARPNSAGKWTVAARSGAPTACRSTGYCGYAPRWQPLGPDWRAQRAMARWALLVACLVQAARPGRAGCSRHGSTCCYHAAGGLSSNTCCKSKCPAGHHYHDWHYTVREQHAAFCTRSAIPRSGADWLLTVLTARRRSQGWSCSFESYTCDCCTCAAGKYAPAGSKSCSTCNQGRCGPAPTLASRNSARGVTARACA